MDLRHSRGDNELNDKQTQVNTEPSFVYKLYIKTVEMGKGNLWNRLYFLFFSEANFGFYLSSEHTIGSEVLSHSGGKCTESTLPCRDFGRHCQQEGHSLYSRQSGCVMF